METCFEIAYILKLVRGRVGLQEQTDLQVHLRPGFLTFLARIEPLALKVLLVLALNARPLEGTDWAALQQLGLVTEADRGHLAAALTDVEIGRQAGIDRKVVRARCVALESEGWLSTRDLPGRQAGRFTGGRLYLLRAGTEILYTSPEALPGPEQGLPIGQGICPPPCPPQGHGDRTALLLSNPAVLAVSPAGTGHVPSKDTVCPPQGHGSGPMGMAKQHGKKGLESPSGLSSNTEGAEPTAIDAGLLQRMLLVLDHFVHRVAERWPAAEDQGPPPARAVARRYEVAIALLASGAAPAAVAPAPADVIEELLVLAQVLWPLRDQGPAQLAAAIDRALAPEDKSPCRRLAVIWPQVPGAPHCRAQLKQVLRQGQALGPPFREAFTLFVWLNHFNVGPRLQSLFLELCREQGPGPVHTRLRQALAEGRGYVTIGFLRQGLSRTAAIPPAAPAPPPVASGPPPAAEPSPAAAEQPAVAAAPETPPAVRRPAAPARRPRPPGERSMPLARFIADISAQFHDIEHLKENDAQAHNLWRVSGIPESEFVNVVQTARQRALALNGVQHQRGGWPLRMPYFFTVLRNLVIEYHLANCGECWDRLAGIGRAAGVAPGTFLPPRAVAANRSPALAGVPGRGAVRAARSGPALDRG